MNLLIIDTETTGVDPQKDSVVEVGAILYNVEHRTVLNQLSFLMPTCGAVNPAYPINRIKPEVLSDELLDSRVEMTSVALFMAMHNQASYAVAHNADFDRQWFTGDVLPPVEIPWLCTYSDFRFPEKSNASLLEIAVAHGVPVVSAHRALTDCQLIAALFSRLDNLEEIIKDAATPRILYVVADSKSEYIKQQAKDIGFTWDKSTGKWRQVKKLTDNEVLQLPFKVVKAS